jgi:hypothetical protein
MFQPSYTIRYMCSSPCVDIPDFSLYLFVSTQTQIFQYILLGNMETMRQKSGELNEGTNKEEKSQ